MAFRVDRRFNLLILEEGEDYVADVAATMALERKGKIAESRGRLRIGSKSLVFQPDEVSASILKFPFRHLKRIGPVDEANASFPIECEQLVQVATKIMGIKTRIVTPFSILKTKMTVSFIVSYATAEQYKTMIRRLWEAAGDFSIAENVVKQILQEASVSVHFDMSRLGHRESALLPHYLWVRRVKPLLQVRGMLQISNEAIYFQPHPNFASKPVKRVALGEVLHVFRRTYGIKANALEIITVHGKCMYLCFETQSECERVAKLLQEQCRDCAARSGIAEGPVASLGDAGDVLHNIHKITRLWQSGQLTNFHYIDFLNCAAGRSQNDFSQYPVFPWVLKDYTCSLLNLADPNVYRDLTKPIGALNTKRLDYFKERMCGMDAEDAFLYGTHYSTPAYVIYWLLRAMPERMLRLHTGHFDALPRLFRSVRESWDSVNESTASLMELIPEFFVLPARWLENSLAIMTPEGQLADVQLPRWAADVNDFISKMRAALESEWTSRHLPAWIDLIFGYKQSGEEAVKADNLFHPVCYTGHPDREPPAANAALPASVLETQLQEFGRVPRKLFSEAHPPRLKMPQWEPDRLRRDPMQSEPWYKAVRHLSGGDVEAVARPGAVATTAPVGASPARAPGEATAHHVELSAKSLQALTPHAATPLTASGCITGVASCTVNMYSIGEDGCLRVSPLENSGAAGAAEEISSRRNFRVSPMPLSALAVLSTDLCVIGGHDNAVTLYSSSCGSALAKCQVHADTVTCLGVSATGSSLVSGSRDQSVRTWHITSSSLKNEATFDDVPQAITCASAGRNLVLAGAEDGQLMAWDLRSGQEVLDRSMAGDIVACALSPDDSLTAALDCTGELRLWDLRHRCESVRLPVAAQAGGCLSSASCFLTDFAGWAVLGGTSVCSNPAVVLWDIPEQRELRTWELSSGGVGKDVRFLVQPSAAEERGSDGTFFLCANATGSVHMFSRH